MTTSLSLCHRTLNHLDVVRQRRRLKLQTMWTTRKSLHLLQLILEGLRQILAVQSVLDDIKTKLLLMCKQLIHMHSEYFYSWITVWCPLPGASTSFVLPASVNGQRYRSRSFIQVYFECSRFCEIITCCPSRWSLSAHCASNHSLQSFTMLDQTKNMMNTKFLKWNQKNPLIFQLLIWDINGFATGNTLQQKPGFVHHHSLCVWTEQNNCNNRKKKSFGVGETTQYEAICPWRRSALSSTSTD